MYKSCFMRAAIVLLLGCVFGVAQAEDSTSSWRKISVQERNYRVVDANGETRDIAPSCSGGPVCTTDPLSGQKSCRQGKTQYSFYFKPGRESKLLVYMDGGGACWNSETCVKGNLGDQPTYRQEITGNSNPEKFGGVFDLKNLSNSYRDWSMVVIPYCTGDIHWGSKDQDYVDETGLVTGRPGGTVTIHHRGFDNFLYVRDWMKRRMDDDVEKVLITGSSAGGYGAAFAFPHLKQTFPRAKAYLMADGANGAITDDFLNVAVRGLDSSWGMQRNLAHWIPGMDFLPFVPAQVFANTYYFTVAGYYPTDRFSQYTTQWDVVQAFFYNTMLHQDEAELWRVLTDQVYGDWVTQATTIMYGNALNPNYRFFIGEGCNHTALTFSDDFYKQSQNHQVQFLDWFKALTRDSDPAWQNMQCANCTTPPTQLEGNICFLRSASR